MEIVKDGELSQEYEQRLLKDMSKYAGEEVSIRYCKGTIYVYSSELGCLRIFAKYLNNGKIANNKYLVKFSENLKTWFFCWDVNF